MDGFPICTPLLSVAFRQMHTVESCVHFGGWTWVEVDSYRGPSPQIVVGFAQRVREKLDPSYCVRQATCVRHARLG
jgi:hypothetical protein